MNGMSAARAAATGPTLNLIPADHVIEVMPIVADALKSVAGRSNGKFTFEGIARRFLAGEWQLWVVWDGSANAVGATFLDDDDDGARVLNIVFWTGEHSGQWLHLLGDLKSWAAVQGCTRSRALVRKGWAKRLPDCQMTHIFLEGGI